MCMKNTHETINKIEIYGIPDDLYRCYACNEAKRLLESKGIPYSFIPVVSKSDNELGFDYNKETIKNLALLVNGGKSLAMSYPKIVVDGSYIGGYNSLQNFIESGE